MKKRSNKQELAALKAASIKKEKHDATMAVLYILAGLLCTVLVVTGECWASGRSGNPIWTRAENTETPWSTRPIILK